MKKAHRPRTYLVQFSSHNLPQIFTDVLVIGSGIAGLNAALRAAASCSVLVVTKAKLRDSCTNEAQGGIAVALRPPDSPDDHLQDTLTTGDGLCDEAMARMLTSEAPPRVSELIEMGVQFDRRGAGLSFTREGGHRRARILHANGDATGAAIESTLVRCVRARPGIAVMEDAFSVDLVTVDEACHGALLWGQTRGLTIVRAKQVILSTGGCGWLYRETTNPAVATGDGVAMAFRAGAQVQDLEFLQFHPTALYVAGAARALISESLRGEGAVLRNRAGERFMPRYHRDAELAPRDTVSRSIISEMKRTGDTHVLLDVTQKSRRYLENRFPTITKLCDRFGLNIASDMIPVRPAAHYTIGGVTVDEFGRTTVPGLLACGEVACTGVHGANRLGSNSLLEGLVFGTRAGQEAARVCAEIPETPPLRGVQQEKREAAYVSLNVTDVENSLRSIMWRNCGVERNGADLGEALAMIEFWCRYVMDKQFESPQGWQLQNMLTVARLMVTAAQRREESRGVHHRTDFPEASEKWRRRMVFTRADVEWEQT